LKRKPNPLDAAAYVGVKIAEWTSYAIIVYVICIAWAITPD